jgi:hypothetical protein
MKTNVMQEKSFAFAIRMIRLSKYLESHRENTLLAEDTSKN